MLHAEMRVLRFHIHIRESLSPSHIAVSQLSDLSLTRMTALHILHLCDGSDFSTILLGQKLHNRVDVHYH